MAGSALRLENLMHTLRDRLYAALLIGTIFGGVVLTSWIDRL